MYALFGIFLPPRRDGLWCSERALSLVIGLIAFGLGSFSGPASADALSTASPKRSAPVIQTSLSDSPVIDVWYGLTQSVHFDAQDDFNLLGDVDHPSSTTMQYRVNDGAWVDLTVGYRSDGFGDARRLAKNGDWNADIPLSTLQEGINFVDVQATNDVGTSTVTVTVVKQLSPSPPDTIDWSVVADPQTVGQYVDGLWTIDASGLRTIETGYDRMYLVGDRTWQDYEILVPVTINRLDPVGGLSGDGSAIGVILRWQGHVVSDLEPARQPKAGFDRLGAITWINWVNGNEEDPYEQFWGGGNNSRGVVDPRSIDLGETYWMRARVVTLPEENGLIPAAYSWKMWRDGESEPDDWDFARVHKHDDMLTAGGPALVAHHVNAAFGDVAVTHLTPEADTVAPVIRDVVADVTNSTATLTWSTNEPTSTRIDYGETTDYGRVVETGFEVRHSVTLTGLREGASYNFRITSTDLGGNTAQYEDSYVVLPVELVSFTAQGDGADVVLRWQTATETNNAGFHVEHRAPDASTWRDVAFRPGAGTVSEATTYTHRVVAVGSGRHAFRLRQVDLDGAATWSDPVEVTLRVDVPYALAVGPSPMQGSGVVRLSVATAQPVRVALYDVLGRRVGVLFDDAVDGETITIPIDVQHLPSGRYFVHARGDGFSTTQALTVVR